MSALHRYRLAKGLTQQELAELAHTSAVQIGRLERWPDGKDARKLTVEWAKRLAPFLDCTAAQLLDVEATADTMMPQRESLPTGLGISAMRVPVRGNVAAGTWYDDGAWDGTETVEVYAGHDPVPGIQKIAYKVIGNSVDVLGIVDGSFVITIPYDMARNGIRNNDVVVVERRRHSQVERTVKQVVIEDDFYRLEPRSTDPRYKPLIVPRGPAPIADDTEIEIVGLVIGSYRAFL